MHTCQGGGVLGSEFFQKGMGDFRIGEIIHGLTKLFAWLKNIFFSDDWQILSTLCKQIAAKQGAGSLLHQITGFPAVGQMGRVDPLYRMRAEGGRFSMYQSRVLRRLSEMRDEVKFG